MSTITQTLRLEVVKPADGDWDALGAKLRALQAPLHRVMNTVITDLELGRRSGKYAKGNDAGPKGKDLNARTDCYRMVRDVWAAERETAAARVAEGKRVRGGEQVAALEPSSRVTLGVAGLVYARFQKWEKDRWAGTSSLPTFRDNAPIAVVGQGVKLELCDGDAVLSLHLAGKRWERIIVRPYKNRDWSTLRRLCAGGAKLGDVRIARDTRGKPKWQAFVSYTAEREKSPQGGRTMALHRGVWCFLTAAIAREGTEPAETRRLESGEDIVETKRRFAARKRSLGRQSGQLGRGAKGRGRKRRFRHKDSVRDAESRWVDTKCREVAAHAIKLAKRRHVTRILIDSWSNPAGRDDDVTARFVRDFPLGKLKEKLTWAAKRAGIEVVEVGGAYESRDCPHCGHRHEAPPLRRDAGQRASVFLCDECRLERPVDTIAAWNMLIRDGHPCPLADAKRREREAAERLKGEAAE